MKPSDDERDARADAQAVQTRWTTTPGLTCIHARAGLCPACLDDYLEDPTAWMEYGNHPQGIANWQEEERRIAEEMVDLTDLPDDLDDRDDDVPF